MKKVLFYMVITGAVVGCRLEGKASEEEKRQAFQEVERLQTAFNRATNDLKNKDDEARKAFANLQKAQSTLDTIKKDFDRIVKEKEKANADLNKANADLNNAKQHLYLLAD